MTELSPRHLIAKALNPHCLCPNILTCPCDPGPVARHDADTVLQALLTAGYRVEALDPEPTPGPVLNMTDSDAEFEAGDQP